MKSILLALTCVFSVNALAAEGNAAVRKAAAKIQSEFIRTTIRQVENTDGNPCMPEGKSYEVDLLIREGVYNRETNKMEYSWKFLKTLGVDSDGRVMEVCAE